MESKFSLKQTQKLSQTVKYLGLLCSCLTWTQHIKSKRLQLNNSLRTLISSPLHRNKHTNLNIKLIIYKTLLDMRVPALGLCSKKIKHTKIQTFQNIYLIKITNVPPFILNLTLHNDLKIAKVLDEAKCYYKRFHTKLLLHSNPLIKKLSSLSIIDNPPRWLMRRWCQDLLS